jgi:two-component system cell cycle response regulator
MSMKLLTIDDCPVVRRSIVNSLRNYDCTILEANGGAEGLAIASREHPNVILLDYQMPGMDGVEVLSQMRANVELMLTPVIMLTAESARTAVVKVARLGVRDYLLKPVNGKLLVEKLSRMAPLRSKAEQGIKPEGVDCAIHILVVDDQPAIEGQIRAHLADTPWKVIGAADCRAGMVTCLSRKIDLVVASLLLPKEEAFRFFHSLQGHAATAGIPMLGLSVKKCQAERERAVAAGFAGNVTKPLDGVELKAQIWQAFNRTSCKLCFQECDGALVLTIPKDFDEGLQREIDAILNHELMRIVNAGGDRMIMDLTRVASATTPVLAAISSVARACDELCLKRALAGSEALRKECEAKEPMIGWQMAENPVAAAQMLADIRLEAAPKPQPGSQLAILVLDCSESMAGDKIEQTKSGANDFAVEALHNGYSVGLIRFSDDVSFLCRPTRELDELRPKIGGLRNGGGTNMAEAVQVGADHLSSISGMRTLVVVTDGMPDNPSAVLDIAARAKTSGIEIIAIGTDDADRDFLDKLASRSELMVKSPREMLAQSIVSAAKMLPQHLKT